MKTTSFKDLEIWKRSIKLVENIYKITKTFPQEELYGLTSQLRRSAVSIPSNIAEGFGRFHKNEYKQFLHIAIGSCAEVSTQIIIASKPGYLENAQAEILVNELEEISKMTMGIIKKLKTLPDN
jgi:four helix bundle protein